MTNNPGTYEEVPCDVIAHTDSAILIDTGGEEKDEDCHWVPKSLLDPEEEIFEKGDKDVLVFVARWFVEKEGIQ